MPKTYVYVDGFNLYYGALKRTPYKWLDLGKLCQLMLPNDEIDSIQYFTARVSARPYSPSAPIDQQVYLRALRTIPKLTITFGHFLTHSIPMMLSGSTPPKKVFVDKTEEKGSDVNLAAHLLRDAFLKRFDVAALITNDSDLAEPVRIVREELDLPIGLLNPHQYHSKKLQPLAYWVEDRDCAVAAFGSTNDSKAVTVKRMKRIENLNVGGVYAQGIVRDDGSIRSNNTLSITNARRIEFCMLRWEIVALASTMMSVEC